MRQERIMTDDVSHVDVEQRRGIPLVWAIPLLAAAIGAWLAYTTWSRKGPAITITFEAAQGLQPGTSPIKYRDVEMGVVKSVDLSDDLSHVVVTAEMKKSATSHLREGTQFWIESVRLSASGVSGLGTLLSGVYIGMSPGEGKPARRFTGLEEAPVLQVNQPGHKFQLRAERLGSLAAGSPIYFRGIPAGEVLGYDLDSDGSGVSIYAFVHAPYDALVRDQSRFWNASGIDMSVGTGGLTVRTESLAAIIEGGIAFDTPVSASAGEPSKEGATFALYPSFESIKEAQFTIKNPYLLYFQETVGGLAPGAAVVCRGIQVGVVESVRLEVDATTHTIRIPVGIAMEPQRFTIVGLPAGSVPQEQMARFVQQGLRAQLRSANLITGAQEIALEFFPTAAPAELTWVAGRAVIPTIPSETTQLMDKATAFIDNLSKAQISQLVGDLRTTVQDLNRVVGSKSVQEGVGPLLDDARAMVAQADATLKSADGVIGPDSALRYDMANLFQELTRMSRSLRTLADYLERNPNALIFGKGRSGDK
jgi:paraquat-inducible protein B